MRALAIVCILLLAGCLGGADTNPKNDPRPEPEAPTDTPASEPDVDTPASRVAMLLDFTYHDCDGQRMRLPADLDEAQARLPAGYIVAGDDAASLEYLWMACASMTTTNAVINDTVYGHVAVQIAPPGNATGASEHWYLLRMLTEEGTLQEIWEIAGYEVYTGTYNDAPVAPTSLPLPEPRTISLGDYSVEARPLSGNGAPVEERTFYTEVPGGRLEWTGTLSVEELRGFGTLDVPSDDPFPDVGGSPTGDQRLFVGALEGNDLWLARAL